MISIYVQIQENKSFAKRLDTFDDILTQKILDYARRQSKRTNTEKEKDYKEMNEDQKKWFESRMKAPSWTWHLFFVGLHFTEEQKLKVGLTIKPRKETCIDHGF